MAVYTALSLAQINHLFQAYELGIVTLAESITDGIENTTYLLEFATAKKAILTLYESQPAEQINFLNRMITQLGKAGLPVAVPFSTRDGETLSFYNQKPVVISPFLSGDHPSSINSEICFQLGQAVAQFHLALTSFEPDSRLKFQHPWWQTNLTAFKSQLNQHDRIKISELSALFERQKRCYSSHELESAMGWIHGDLFRDNVKIIEHQITGMIDFSHSQYQFWLFDLAIIIHDWCLDQNHHYDKKLVSSLIRGYRSYRPFNPMEHQLWPLILPLAALKFWLSRLKARQQNQGQILDSKLRIKIDSEKDPNQYRRLFYQACQACPALH